MLRKLAILFAFFGVLGVLLPEASPLAPTTAHAQQERKTLLELLFGGGLRNQRAQQPQQQNNKQAKRVKVQPSSNSGSSSGGSSSTRAAAPASVTPVVVVEKAENAAKVLIIGDFMATQLAQGLEQQFAKNPNVIIVEKTVALSGMVREDVRNWPADIAATIDEVNPIAVVALVGMNDRQLISMQNGRLEKLTEGWLAEYERRADLLARNIREKRIPMIWVGLPPVSKRNMNVDYLRFNDIYRQTVEAYGGIYVDVWDGFLDTEGQYVRSGPDVNGQIVSLRRADGINMTSKGYEKLAFFAEKAIKRITGFGRDALVSSLGGLSELPTSTQPLYDPAGTGKSVVIALGSPSADGGTALEGEEGFLTATDARESNAFELVAHGVAMQPQDGRIDSGWGRPSFDLGREETPEPVLANMRGYSLKSLLDELPPLAGEEVTVEPGTETIAN